MTPDFIPARVPLVDHVGRVTEIAVQQLEAAMAAVDASGRPPSADLHLRAVEQATKLISALSVFSERWPFDSSGFASLADGTLRPPLRKPPFPASESSG